MSDRPVTHVDGLHHVTAISGKASRTDRFYTRVLGQRRVKKTVNFDDPGTWHLYYADARGTPGTVMTFFPWEGARRGRVGAGQVVLTEYAIPERALDWWEDRLATAGAETRRESAFGETRLVFTDPDGLPLALVERPGDDRAPWTGAGVPEDRAVLGFAGATLGLHEEEGTARILKQVFGYARETEQSAGGGRRIRYRSASGGAPVLDLQVDPAMPEGMGGPGSVHHIAFSVPDRTVQARVAKALAALGHPPTQPIDRDYFWAIYLRTPGGVLFEVATEEPGFTRDEPLEVLGEDLRIPAQHAHLRARIEAALPPLDDGEDG